MARPGQSLAREAQVKLQFVKFWLQCETTRTRRGAGSPGACTWLRAPRCGSRSGARGRRPRGRRLGRRGTGIRGRHGLGRPRDFAQDAVNAEKPWHCARGRVAGGADGRVHVEVRRVCRGWRRALGVRPLVATTRIRRETCFVDAPSSTLRFPPTSAREPTTSRAIRVAYTRLQRVTRRPSEHIKSR